MTCVISSQSVEGGGGCNEKWRHAPSSRFVYRHILNSFGEWKLRNALESIDIPLKQM